MLAGCHGGAAVATKLNRISNNARRIKTFNYLHYSGISKVSGYFCVDVMSTADGRVAPFIPVRFRDIRFLHLDGSPKNPRCGLQKTYS
nr:MAG TPA: hypothetical protein [Caudoviricetes sp.]